MCGQARGGGEDLLERMVQVLRPFFIGPRVIYGCPHRLPEADFYPEMRAASGWLARRWHVGHAPAPCRMRRCAVASFGITRLQLLTGPADAGFVFETDEKSQFTC